MLFSISEELEMTRSVIREFAESKIAPNAGERDDAETFDRSIFAKMGELGITGIPIGERYGGAGSDWMTYTVVLEELSRVCASTAAALAAHTVYTAWPIYAFGSEETKASYLKELASGNRLGACALPNIKNEKARMEDGITTRLNRENWELNGVYSFAIQAEIADSCVVFAQIGKGKRKSGFNAFLVESGTAGFEIGKKVRKLGLRSLMTAEIRFKQCMIPKKNRIGQEGQSQEMAHSLIDIGHISAAAQAVGIAQGALEAAAAYAKERKQFGTPIGKQQGISFKLADMSAKIEAARLLAYQAAWRKDADLDCGRESAIARKFTADTAVAVTIEAVQIFGGYGYMQEYRMERYLRDAKCLETEIGTGGMETDCIYRVLTE